MKSTTTFNLIAALAVMCATGVVIAGADLDFAKGLVLLAGTIVGRGK